MSYQKHVWVTKEIIRKERLNHIEDGIYDEEQRAVSVESNLLQQINAEAQRAMGYESSIMNAVVQIQAQLNNSGYLLVEDHTNVESPKDNVIYIELNGTVYEQWIYQNQWIKIGG